MASSIYNQKKMGTVNANIPPMLFFQYYSENCHCRKGLRKSNFLLTEIKISTKLPVFASLFFLFTVSPKTIIKDQTINYVAKVVIKFLLKIRLLSNETCILIIVTSINHFDMCHMPHLFEKMVSVYTLRGLRCFIS